MSAAGWIGFDLDGTLAYYEKWGDGSIGEPIPAMVTRVKLLLAAGVECRIVTARVSQDATPEEREAQRLKIRAWCGEHIGVQLPVTCEKDFTMLMLFDDRAVAVEKNTGRILGACPSLGLRTIE